jgi:recombination protein RecT
MPSRTPEAVAQATVAGTDTEPTLALAVRQIDSDLTGKQSALADALAGSYDPRYFMSVALSQFRRSPSLHDVAKTVQGRTSFVDAVVQAAQYGLPFLAGRAYLVPFRNHGVVEAQLIVGYQGLVDLVTAPGTGVTFVEAAVVYEHDTFAYQKGTDPFLTHVPYRFAGDDGVVDRGKATDVWARVVYATGQSRFDVMNVTEVEAIRKRSKAGQSGPWVTDWDPMACKTVLRRICKTLRISLRVMEMLDREDELERGTPEATAARGTQSIIRSRLAERLAAPEAESATEPAADEPPPPEAPAPPPAPERAPTMDGACGATAKAGGGVVACHLAHGHRGQHSDGQHDWPATTTGGTQ